MKVLSSGVDVALDAGFDEWQSSQPLRASRPRLVAGYTGTETILLVDDERVIRNLLTVAMERYGYRVLAATDGENAIEVAAEHRAPIHLLLSDVVMPRLDGCALSAELRRWYPSVGVLLMSGFPDGMHSALDISDDLTFFIRKPFSMDALAAAVRSSIDWRPKHAPD
jgi:two-component system cell cycle sensor histidine kinase/response regulator CckA